MTLLAKDVQRLHACLADGGVAVFPADTVYGLCCDPENADAVRRLYELKGRPAERPAAVMWFAVQAALDALPGLREAECTAIERVLPGPVTLLLPNRERRYPLACGPSPETLGLRVPRLDGRLAALGTLVRPVLQSSANISGEGEARTVTEISPELLGAVDLVLDAGELPGVASTVLDLREYVTHDCWRIMRAGPLDPVALERELGESSC